MKSPFFSAIRIYPREWAGCGSMQGNVWVFKRKRERGKIAGAARKAFSSRISTSDPLSDVASMTSVLLFDSSLHCTHPSDKFAAGFSSQRSTCPHFFFFSSPGTQFLVIWHLCLRCHATKRRQPWGAAPTLARFHRRRHQPSWPSFPSDDLPDSNPTLHSAPIAGYYRRLPVTLSTSPRSGKTGRATGTRSRSSDYD